MKYNKICHCGKSFVTNRTRSKFCSMKCRKVPKEDLCGKKFGWLSVIKEVGSIRKPSGGIKRMFYCKCNCGKYAVKSYSSIKSTRIVNASCGCFMSYHAKNRIKHGMSNTRIFKIWAALQRRCTKPKCPEYINYGAKGVSICERWRSFENFYEDMKEGYKDDLTLDRFPNQSGNYEPNNCRWATYKEQMRNVAANVIITAFGETKCVSEFSEITGVPRGNIYHRLKKGLSPEDAICGVSKRRISPEQILNRIIKFRNNESN